MPKDDIITDLIQARAKLQQAIEGLTPDQMLRVGAVGIWSVKDVIAHLTAWESEIVTTLSHLDQHKRRAPTMVEIEDLDEWNDEQYRISAARPIDAVLEDFHGVHKHLIKAVQELDERTLDSNRMWPWMEGEPLSYLVYENAIWHEEEHAAEISEWREKQGF